MNWRRLNYKDREEVMENVATHEDWKVCFSQVGPGLVLFARNWVRSPADAEDVVQEAFVKLWRRKQRIDNGAGGSRATWTGKPERVGERGRESINRALLYATVRSIALDFIRRDSRRARRESDAVAETEQFTEPQFAMEDESQQALVAAIDGLPAEQREVLVMKIWNELTFSEIGSALGISQNTAASRYRYALGALKKNFVSP
jgi:RNA polymerase sigma factor (sigma-70 family)